MKGPNRMYIPHFFKDLQNYCPDEVAKINIWNAML